MQREEQFDDFEQENKHWRIKRELNEIFNMSNQQFKIETIQSNSERILLKLFFKYQQQPDKNLILSQSNQQSYKYHQFVMIIDHQVYPFSPPYLIISQEFMFPKLNDFRNIIDDLFQSDKWWPTYTLQKIIQKIPLFLQGLISNKIQFKGSYYYEKEFLKTDIQMYGKGLNLHKGLFLVNKDSIVGKYHENYIGISFDYILLFKQNSPNKLKIQKVVSMKKIKLLEMMEKGQYTKIKFYLIKNKGFFNNEEILQFKIKTSEILNSQIQQLLLIFNYFKLMRLNQHIKTLSIQGNDNPQSQIFMKSKNMYKKKIQLISILLQKADQSNQKSLSLLLKKQLDLLLHDETIINMLFPVT